MHPGIESKTQLYPDHVRTVFSQVRNLILDVAAADCDHPLEETLKWGEPSYLVKGGSTIRIDWKQKYPEYFCLFFNCQTSLVGTIKELYGEVFFYAGNRAVMFDVSKNVPISELKHCISLALNYHKLKHLPLLGA